MANSPETKNNSDQDPQPLRPEELFEFQKLVMDKVADSPKAVKYQDPITEENKTAAMWLPSQGEQVHVDIGTVHEPGYIEILLVKTLGRNKGIDTQIRKFFRYHPIAEVSEYDEDLVEYFNGKRLFGEELQGKLALISEVEVDMDEEKRLAIEHARDFSQRYQGSTLPPMDQEKLAEVTAILAQCNPDNEVNPPHFAGL